MKNIHILPTDKPSRLINYLKDNSWDLFSSPMPKVKEVECKNIYITNSEEIKDDWCYDEYNKVVFKNTGVGTPGASKKIILTTDQYLIKDGVQAIDDEFLEWFVKNPSCESVEVDELCGGCYSNDGDCWRSKECNKGYFKDIYKIIIPQEEPKKDLRKIVEEVFNEQPRELFLMNANSVIDTRIPKEPKQELERGITITHVGKQETLEEALSNYIKDIKYPTLLECAEFGAKWQQEQYKILLDEYHEYTVDCIEIELKRPLAFKKWLKQFKK